MSSESGTLGVGGADSIPEINLNGQDLKKCLEELRSLDWMKQINTWIFLLENINQIFGPGSTSSSHCDHISELSSLIIERTLPLIDLLGNSFIPKLLFSISSAEISSSKLNLPQQQSHTDISSAIQKLSDQIKTEYQKLIDIQKEEENNQEVDVKTNNEHDTKEENQEINEKKKK